VKYPRSFFTPISESIAILILGCNWGISRIIFVQTS